MSQLLSERILNDMSDGFAKAWLAGFLPGVFALFWSILLSLVTYWIGIRVIGHVRKIVRKGLDLHGAETGVKQFCDAVVRIIGFLLIAIIVLKLFGVQSASIAAAIASIGVAVGLALQGSFANFAGGVLILLLKPFVVGDYIKEDTHGNEGTVTEISIFFTKLTQVDGRIVIIPNGTLANSSMTNFTSSKERMMDLEFSISYEDDINKAKEIIRRIIDEDTVVLHEKDVLIFVKRLDDSAVILGMRAWVPTPDYWREVWRTNEMVKNSCDEEGITIPFPQITVHKKK